MADRTALGAFGVMSPLRSRRRRRFIGLIPRLGQACGACSRWVLRHLRPFLLCAVLPIMFWGLWNYGQHAEPFRITHVYLPPQSSLTLRESLIGENLWTLDIRTLADELARQQPWLKEVRVVRQLPNAIRIDAIPRQPIAQVRLDRWYPVDREGFILSQASAEPLPQLIRVEGFERDGTALKVGKENTDERLQLALRVLAKLRRAPPAISRRLLAVNVADPHQIRFLLTLSSTTVLTPITMQPGEPQAMSGDGATEVRCGSEDELDTNLQRLGAALKAVTRQSLGVRYIDVRFQEPVVGPRTPNS